MARGSTLVLLNHDNIYEALYDVLNQRYLMKTRPLLPYMDALPSILLPLLPYMDALPSILLPLGI